MEAPLSLDDSETGHNERLIAKALASCLASDGVRARAASAASACDMALSTLFLLLAGSILSRPTR